MQVSICPVVRRGVGRLVWGRSVRAVDKGGGIGGNICAEGPT